MQSSKGPTFEDDLLALAQDSASSKKQPLAVKPKEEKKKEETAKAQSKDPFADLLAERPKESLPPLKPFGKLQAMEKKEEEVKKEQPMAKKPADKMVPEAKKPATKEFKEEPKPEKKEEKKVVVEEAQ